MIKHHKMKALLLPASLLILWQALVGNAPSSPDTLAPPLAILRAMSVSVADGSLLVATAQTLVASGAGLFLGSAIGIALGVLFGLL